MIINHGVRGSTPNPSQNYLFFGGNTPCVEIKTQKYRGPPHKNRKLYFRWLSHGGSKSIWLN